MLTLRSIFWTLLLPGTITVVIPYFITKGYATTNLTGWNLTGTLPMGAGAWILLTCIRDFQIAGRGTLAPVDPPKILVVQGFYRYVRNPMYVGIGTFLLGDSILFWSANLLCYAAAFLILANLFIRFIEEPMLERRFGDSYRVYRSSVRRWLPRFPK